MNKENMLKPCPFCGGPGHLDRFEQPRARGRGWHAVCYGDKYCPLYCSTPYSDLLNREEAIARWNTRTILPDVTEEWRPIETAPDDRWVLVAEAPYEPGPYDAYAAHRHPDGYWMANCGQPVVQSPEPTHWRPLPEPPTIAKDAG